MVGVFHGVLVGICLYCGENRKLSNEHVISGWISDYVPKAFKKQMHTATIYGLRPDHSFGLLDEKAHRGAGDPLVRTLKIVCEPCNNGWMSQIVERAKPHLRPLLAGNWLALSPEACDAIATWAALTSLTWERNHPPTIVTDRSELDYVYENRAPPPRWRVWAGVSATRLETTFFHRAVRLAPVDDVVAHQPETQLNFFTVGNFGFFAAHSRHAELDAMRFHGNFPLASIWPRPDHAVLAPRLGLSQGMVNFLMDTLTEIILRAEGRS